MKQETEDSSFRISFVGFALKICLQEEKYFKVNCILFRGFLNNREVL